MKLYFMKPFSAAMLLLTVLTVPALSIRADDPWEFLDGFILVPGSEARLEEHYLGALFENAEEKMLAVVVFNAACDPDNCFVNHPAAYSVYNDEGINIRRYVDPREQELIRLIFGGPFV